MNSRILAFAVLLSTSHIAFASNDNLDSLPWLRIERVFIHQQCGPNIESVMLNNGHPGKYRVTVLIQTEVDLMKKVVVKPYTREWLGCINDGKSYKILAAELLP